MAGMTRTAATIVGIALAERICMTLFEVEQRRDSRVKGVEAPELAPVASQKIEASLANESSSIRFCPGPGGASSACSRTHVSL